MSKNKIKNKSRSSDIFWRIIISLVGIALIFMAVVNLMLFFFGETAYANVVTRRVGGSNDNSLVEYRYEWSLDYTFTDKNGEQRSGHTTRRGSDMSVKIDNKVYYFLFAPAINSLESETKPNVSQLVLVGFGVLLIYVMNSKKSKSNKGSKNKSKKKDSTNNYNVINEEIEIHDYDDSVEELISDD